jgi:hypothetical protein
MTLKTLTNRVKRLKAQATAQAQAADPLDNIIIYEPHPDCPGGPDLDDISLRPGHTAIICIPDNGRGDAHGPLWTFEPGVGWRAEG